MCNNSSSSGIIKIKQMIIDFQIKQNLEILITWTQKAY